MITTFHHQLSRDTFRMRTVVEVMQTQLRVQLHSVRLQGNASKAALQFLCCHERLITHRRACFCRNFALNKHKPVRGGVVVEWGGEGLEGGVAFPDRILRWSAATCWKSSVSRINMAKEM